MSPRLRSSRQPPTVRHPRRTSTAGRHCRYVIPGAVLYRTIARHPAPSRRYAFSQPATQRPALKHLYGPRWAGYDDGSHLALPLRSEFGAASVPIRTR